MVLIPKNIKFGLFILHNKKKLQNKIRLCYQISYFLFILIIKLSNALSRLLNI